MRKGLKFTEYACAVLLIITSIALAYFSVIDHDEIYNGVLIYIAQSFLLAGSIFGLDYYVQRLTAKIVSNGTTKNDPQGDTK